MDRAAILQDLIAKGLDPKLADATLACLLGDECRTGSYLADLPQRAFELLFGHFISTREMPYGVAKARTGDPCAWISETLRNDYRQKGWL